jgi:DNA mismatch endonuclease (patch repair protein)
MMAAVKGQDTGLEIALRRALWARGLRYRVDYGKERIDIAFPGRKVAIFVDGCFWHMCPIHGTVPSSNVEYWVPKLEANRARDAMKKERLEKEGWTVLRVWEHELDHLDNVLDLINEAL